MTIALTKLKTRSKTIKNWQSKSNLFPVSITKWQIRASAKALVQLLFSVDFQNSAEPGGGYLFLTANFNRMEYHNFRKAMSRLFEEIGVTAHINPHMFRHQYAVNFLTQGGNLFRLSKILGHSDISIAQTYLKTLSVEALSDVRQKLSSLMPKGSQDRQIIQATRRR